MTLSKVPAQKYAEWKAWATREFAGDESAARLATDFVLRSLLAGYSVEHSIKLAHAAVYARKNGAPNVPLNLATAAQGGLPSRPVSDATHLRGRVSALRQRNEVSGKTAVAVLTFRVDSWDSQGRAQPAVAIEMRGSKPVGSLNAGDWVEIQGKWVAGAVNRTSKIHNLTMNAPFLLNGDRPARKMSFLEELGIALIFMAGTTLIWVYWLLIFDKYQLHKTVFEVPFWIGMVAIGFASWWLLNRISPNITGTQDE
jgi:hypothetical protein